MTLSALFVLMTITGFDSEACTSAIISGRVTADGRPLLWKNRDTSDDQNKVMFFNDGKYRYVAIAGTEETVNSIWIGYNEKGFAIMNTVSRNIVPEGEEVLGRNGRLMKEALMQCADMADFEKFLDEHARPLGANTNLGVIDAAGNAAYYEVNNDTYIKFDVNDPATAPLGYIARSNFSFAGNTTTGAGYARFVAADELTRQGVLHKDISPSYIFDNLARCYYNPVTGINLKEGSYNRPNTTGWFVDQDFITRYTSVSDVVIQGVKEGENVELMTMWTIVGWPSTTVAVPVWLAPGEEGANNLLWSKSGSCDLCKWGVDLKKKVYSFTAEPSKTSTYFNWEMLWNPQGEGIIQKVTTVEHEVLAIYSKALEGWRKAGSIDRKELKKINGVCEEKIRSFYAQDLSVDID